MEYYRKASIKERKTNECDENSQEFQDVSKAKPKDLW